MTMNYQYVMSNLGQSEGELQVGLGSVLGSGDGGTDSTLMHSQP